MSGLEVVHQIPTLYLPIYEPGINACVACGGVLYGDMAAGGAICINVRCGKYVRPSYRCASELSGSCEGEVAYVGFWPRCNAHIGTESAWQPQ